MSVTHSQGSVLWASASTKSVTSATEVVSDVFTLADTTVGVNFTVSANNAGTPASGDTAIFRVRWSNDGTNYDTAEHATFMTTLDTFTTNTPGENPARRTISMDRRGSKFTIGTICANAATRNITIAVAIEEEKGV